MTVGPWKPIYLHTYTHRITDLRITSEFPERNTIDLTIDVTATKAISSPSSKAKVEATILDSQGVPKIGTRTAEFTKNKKGDIKANLYWETSSQELELWWPVGYGKQVLYTVEVKLFDGDGKVVDIQRKRVGLRKVRVVQTPFEDQEGRSFLFEVNGVPMFCGGSNWYVCRSLLLARREGWASHSHLDLRVRIPADSFLTEITPERYRNWLQLLVDGNQNMVRVWAGGIYETDEFYDICDGALNLPLGRHGRSSNVFQYAYRAWHYGLARYAETFV